MVDGIGKFAEEYFPGVKSGDKIDIAGNDTLKRTIFQKVDDGNETLDDNEVNSIKATEELEGDARQAFLDSFLNKDAQQLVDKVILVGPDKNIVIITSKAKNAKNLNSLLVFNKVDENTLVPVETREFDNNGVEIITTYNADGTKTVRNGVTTTELDAKDRVTKVKVDGGQKGMTVTEYEYEGDSNVPIKATVTKPDGSVETQVDGIKNPNVPSNDNNEVDEVDDDSDTDTDTDVDSDSDDDGAHNTPVDRTKPLYAKNGESFLATARRIFGDDKLTKDDPRYKALAAANPKAAAKGWFVLAHAIVVPDSVKDKIVDEAFTVDKKEQEKAYTDGAKARVKDSMSSYNDTNTEETTINKTTSWWMLAKKNLQEVDGKAEPTNKEIYERIGVLMSLNEGVEQPVAGTKLVMPKKAAAAPPADGTAAPEGADGTDAPEGTDAPGSSEVPGGDEGVSQGQSSIPEKDTNPPVKDNNPPQKDSLTIPAKDENPPQKDSTVPQQPYEDMGGKHKVTLSTDAQGKVTSYTEQFLDDNAEPYLYIERNADGSVKFYVRLNDSQHGIVEYNPDGSVIDYTDYEYNAAGAVVKSITRKPDGSVEEYFEEVYDSSGQHIRTIKRNPDGAVAGYSNDGEVDDKGVPIWRNPDGTIRKETSTPKDGSPAPAAQSSQPQAVPPQADDAPQPPAAPTEGLSAKVADAMRREDIDEFGIPPEALAELRRLGIPDAVIKEGDEAIRKYAEENDIELPERR